MEKRFKKGTSGNAQIDRMFDDVYNFLNEIVDTLNSTSGKQAPNDPEGSLRVVKKDDDSYIVAVKGIDGWLVSDGTKSTGFRFQTKLD